MKTTITLEFKDDDAEAVAGLTGVVDVGLLLRDALGEFIESRTPVGVYVQSRYLNQSERFRQDKAREVAKRVALATLLVQGGYFILVDAPSK
jgi:hypothetical protein